MQVSQSRRMESKKHYFECEMLCNSLIFTILTLPLTALTHLICASHTHLYMHTHVLHTFSRSFYDVFQTNFSIVLIVLAMIQSKIPSFSSRKTMCIMVEIEALLVQLCTVVCKRSNPE